MMRMAEYAARIGAVFYVLWGVFHLVAANAVYALAEQSTGLLRARLLQDAFYLLFFAVAGILMAVIMNWRNDKQGFWMNGTLIAFADIPFVLFVLAPGLIPWWPGRCGAASLADRLRVHDRCPLLSGPEGRSRCSCLRERFTFHP
jgi:hypothetical protein